MCVSWNILSGRFFILLTVLAALGGCTPFSPKVRSSHPLEVPMAFAWNMNGTAPIDTWWQEFGSHELDHFIDTALGTNFNLRSSWARLNQAMAAAIKSRAGLFPVLNSSLEGSRTRTYRHGDINTDSKSASLDLAASYELDLWGRIRAGYAADQLSTMAAQEDVRTTALSLTGEVVSAWVDLLAAREEMRVVQEQIRLNEQLLTLQVSRFENGMASALDVSQQQELVANSRSALPLLAAREKTALNQLALLLGQADSESVDVHSHVLPQPLAQPETGIPSNLLMSRPDVRAAYYRLQSADWAVSAARADRLPSLSISARTAISSDSFTLAWGDWLTRLGANLTGPVFDAGTRRAEVARTQAVVDERLAEYAAIVLKAIKEVQDSLANIAGQKKRIARMEQELRAAEQARDQARLRYIKGQSDYLNFITQQRSVQSLERNLVAARADLLSSQIALYRALGGGTEWNET